MSAIIREFSNCDIHIMTEIWNEVVECGNAFPQTEALTPSAAKYFFENQSFTGVAEANNKILGLYILHPNNVGRCSHIANASYAVKADARGQGIGEQLVKASISKAKELGFEILQFNAVVKSNHTAIKLYEKLGFVTLGTIPKGFKKNDGTYEDIIPFYHTL